MKNLYTIIKLSLISLVLPFLFFSNLVAQNAVTIPHSKSIKLYSPAIQDTFAISIAFPEQYDSSDKSYPVIYVTDPFFVYGSTVESARMHVYDGRMPEAIIVGIGYPGPQKFRRIMQLRTREYTILDRFVFPSGFTPQWAKEMDLGNAQEFLSFMEDNLFPYITENYRVSDERTYIGWSGGGWYGHYVLFHQPNTFDNYLLGSSAYWYERDREYEGNLFEYEEQYAAENDTLDVKIFLSVGDLESHYMTGGMLRMAQTLESRNYHGLQIDWKIFDDYDHYSVWPVAVNKGLLRLFENRENQATGGLDKIEE